MTARSSQVWSCPKTLVRLAGKSKVVLMWLQWLACPYEHHISARVLDKCPKRECWAKDKAAFTHRILEICANGEQIDIEGMPESVLSRSSEEMQAKDVPYLSPKALIERKWRDIKKIRWQCVTGNTLSSFTAPWSPFKNRIIIITTSSSSTSISISIITAIYSVVLLTEWGVVFKRRSQGESDSVLNRDRERERRAQRETKGVSTLEQPVSEADSEASGHSDTSRASYTPNSCWQFV